MKIKGLNLILNKSVHKDSINYFITDEEGNILMNIETGKLVGKRVLLMTESLKACGFKVEYIEK